MELDTASQNLQLLRENKRSPQPGNPQVTTRIPVNDLTVYPELTTALSSIEEDFFHSPLKEEESKIAL
ncbi:hypothetical protein AYI68_g1875 [Smittium mucronatum]|uniref:Uncharacterized protein n=1 Tax=Smittium mucronatum TaxID=133383 RepID=A0A1R0H4J1_9FUNG|nr:hypothetical protein AYI68_g1875 [Smittium mucronatum]